MKQIDIKELIPFMKGGYVAMDSSGDWYWYHNKPLRELYGREWLGVATCLSTIFDIKTVSDCTQSLIKVENDNAR